MLHDAIADTLQREDALQPSVDPPYGIRKFPDFRWEADAIQAEFQKRSIPFRPIKW